MTAEKNTTPFSKDNVFDRSQKGKPFEAWQNNGKPVVIIKKQGLEKKHIRNTEK